MGTGVVVRLDVEVGGLVAVPVVVEVVVGDGGCCAA